MYSGNQPGFKCNINAESGLYIKSIGSGNNGESSHSVDLSSGLLTLTHNLDARGQYSDVTGQHFTSGGAITAVFTPDELSVNTPTATMYGVMSKDSQYYINVTEELPTTPYIGTIYIITEGANKGL